MCCPSIGLNIILRQTCFILSLAGTCFFLQRLSNIAFLQVVLLSRSQVKLHSSSTNHAHQVSLGIGLYPEFSLPLRILECLQGDHTPSPVRTLMSLREDASNLEHRIINIR